MLLHPYAERAVGHESPSPIYYRLVDAEGEHFITQHALVDRVKRLREIEEDQVDSFAASITRVISTSARRRFVMQDLRGMKPCCVSLNEAVIWRWRRMTSLIIVSITLQITEVRLTER